MYDQRLHHTSAKVLDVFSLFLIGPGSQLAISKNKSITSLYIKPGAV